VAITVKGYYDGTGSPATLYRGEIIGLAGYAARPEVWDVFESKWWQILADSASRPPCRYLHMREARALRGEFSRDRGWTQEKVQTLLQDLFNECFSRRGLAQPIPEVLVGASCSVDLDAYDRVCERYPHFIEKKPEALCVDHVVTAAIKQLVPPGERMGMHEMSAQRLSVELYFDRNESFRHHIFRVWDALPWHRRPFPLRLVKKIGTAERQTSAALQAADYLAWHTNRDIASESGDLSARAMAMFAAPWYGRHYDYEELEKTAARWRPGLGYDAPVPDQEQ
jgi:hypothetical protein